MKKSKKELEEVRIHLQALYFRINTGSMILNDSALSRLNASIANMIYICHKGLNK